MAEISPPLITKIPWNAKAENGLRESAGRDLYDIKAEVIGGVSELWECRSDKGNGFIVTRLENYASGKELVIVLGEGRNVAPAVVAIIEAADALGIPTIRAHLKRKGLIKMFQSMAGFEIAEYVLRRENGRQK